MKKFAVFCVVAGAAAAPASACDLCAIYNVHAAEATRNEGFSISVAEQFTHFDTLQEDGRKVSNPAHQYLNSSITQIVPGYTFNDLVGVQLSVPIIYREFRRAEDTLIERDSESGLGDVSLVGTLTPLRIEHKDTTFNWNVFGGVKFPTGDSDRIREETEESHHDDDEDHEHVRSGVHGHDIALGSGSFDGIVGTGFYARYRRGFFAASVQYAIRSRGDFDYRYGNDLMWSGGPGLFLVLEEEWTASVQFIVSGEDKDLDHFNGRHVDDTGMTSVYLGPQLNVTWSDKLSAHAAVDLPVLRDNTGLQIVPDFRLRGGLTWRF